MAKNIAATRITKKLLPLQPGAKKLTARYGEALIYVRYRLDPTEDRRYTTVELLGADGPAITIPKTLQPVYLRLAENEVALWQTMLKDGAQWDKTRRAWRVTDTTAKRLRIHHRALADAHPYTSQIDPNT